MGISVDGLGREIDQALDKLPRVSGNNQVSLSNELHTVIQTGSKTAKDMHDEYVSVEHLFMALAVVKSKAAELLQAQGANPESILRAMQDIRGAQRVTDQNPEDKFQALDRYTRGHDRPGPLRQAGSGHRPGRRDQTDRAGPVP